MTLALKFLPAYAARDALAAAYSAALDHFGVTEDEREKLWREMEDL